jgi:1-acyl-sn-glycerol-3-phosphate acyltransferase
MARWPTVNNFDIVGLIKGSARTVGFFALLLAFVPPQLYLLVSRRGDPYFFTRLFHRLLTRLLSFDVRVHGRHASNEPILFVANHSSYLDIPVLGSLIPASFVAKAEVANWPLIGFMARLQQTAFIERRAVRAAEQRSSLRERLAKGQSLILFPEGTSSDGQRTLPFKTSLFSLAEATTLDGHPVTVQPVSILCTGLCGLPIGRDERPYYAWFGDMTLLPHLWTAFKLGHFRVDVIFHDPVSIGDFSDRKTLAAYCRIKIAQGVEQCVTGRFVASSTLALPCCGQL